MIAFGHTAVGAIVGASTYYYFGDQEPIIGLSVALGAGLASHYIFDLIPHGHFFKSDYKKNIAPVIIFDLFFSVALFLFTQLYFHGFNIGLLYILFGIGASQAPDILDGLIYIGRIPNKGIIKTENNFHLWTHWHGRGKNVRLLGLSDIWQLVIVLLGLFIIFNI